MYGENPDANSGLLEDLGDRTLFDELNARDKPDVVPPATMAYMKDSLRHLARMQIIAGPSLDFTVCTPHQDFDFASMFADLEYFRKWFLDKSGTEYDQQKLQKDFQNLAGMLDSADRRYFMYRDFQSRNIMITGGAVRFIDYQGGRRGALPYDIASLLYQARAALPDSVREALLESYLEDASKLGAAGIGNFRKYYDGFVLLRFLQVLGAYGFRGIHERRPHFLKSIGLGMQNLRRHLETGKIPPGLPELEKCIAKLSNPEILRNIFTEADRSGI